MVRSERQQQQTSSLTSSRTLHRRVLEKAHENCRQISQQQYNDKRKNGRAVTIENSHSYMCSTCSCTARMAYRISLAYHRFHISHMCTTIIIAAYTVKFQYTKYPCTVYGLRCVLCLPVGLEEAARCHIVNSHRPVKFC